MRMKCIGASRGLFKSMHHITKGFQKSGPATQYALNMFED